MIGLLVGLSVLSVGAVAWIVYPRIRAWRNIRALLRASDKALRAVELRHIDVPDDPLVDAFEELASKVRERERLERQATCSHRSTVQLVTIGVGVHEYCQVCGAESEPGMMLDKPSLNR